MPDAGVQARIAAARFTNGEPPGWDVVTARAVGDVLAVNVNGVPAVAARLAEMPRAGRVRVEVFAFDWATEPSRVEFRSLRVRPLAPAAERADRP